MIEETLAEIDALKPVVGVDLGGTQIRAAVLQGDRLLARFEMLTGDPAPRLVIPRMFQAVEQVLVRANTTLEQIVGIGIGAPGPLNGRTGMVFEPPNLPGWDQIPLRDIFYERFKIPVSVENDANAAALGEHLFGAGRGANEMVYLTVSTGIGGGVISNGKLLRGISGTAAELGHITIDWRGERCNCGNIGCLESIASGTAIARYANEAIARGQGEQLLEFALSHRKHEEANTPTDNAAGSPIHVNARVVGLAAEAGVELAQQIIKRAAEGLGVGLVNIIHTFNPEIVILGGGVMQMGAMLLEPARRVVEERVMPVPRMAARLVLAELGADVGLVGAGALIYDMTKAVHE